MWDYWNVAVSMNPSLHSSIIPILKRRGVFAPDLFNSFLCFVFGWYSSLNNPVVNVDRFFPLLFLFLNCGGIEGGARKPRRGFG
jgi:hypothetical protein